MYTIKNKSNKIIHIATTILMPDQSMRATDQVAATPAVKAFEKRGLLSLVQDSDQTPEKDEGSTAEKENGEDAPEVPEAAGSLDISEAPKPRGTRRTAKTQNPEE